MRRYPLDRMLTPGLAAHETVTISSSIFRAKGFVCLASEPQGNRYKAGPGGTHALAAVADPSCLAAFATDPAVRRVAAGARAARLAPVPGVGAPVLLSTSKDHEGHRVLHRVLLDVDRERRWGGLRSVVTGAGDRLWVCREHYLEYEPDLPKLLPA